jgi:hypothetical protein
VVRRALEFCEREDRPPPWITRHHNSEDCGTIVNPDEVAPDRDGSSPQAAIAIDSVAGEYGWLQKHLPGFFLTRQALTQFDGRMFDVLTIRNDAGIERQIFFDVSSFYGRKRRRKEEMKKKKKRRKRTGNVLDRTLLID